MNTSYAKVIADSIGPDETRVTTMEVRFHRFVLAEFNTHRVFSRNSASSRAIPVAKQLKMLREDGPAFPLEWPAEQKGMQGGELFTDPELVEKFRWAWNIACKNAVNVAEVMTEYGVHKSVVNRLLEPYMWHTVVVTSTAWNNFFKQRSSHLAQPEIRTPSDLMIDALFESEPVELNVGQWHTPYVDAETAEEYGHNYVYLRKISAARCARASHLTQAGVRDGSEDLNLYARLMKAAPRHWSPLEHTCTPDPTNHQEGFHVVRDGDESFAIDLRDFPKVGNLRNFTQLRTLEAARSDEVTYA